MHEKEILSALREAMSEDDSERVEEIIDEYEDDWEDGSLAVKALEIAVETGNYDYIDEHVDDFDTTEMGYLLDHTDDDEIIALLNDHGIFRDWEDYGDCLFAFESVNCTILAFDPDFRREVWKKYREEYGISDRDVMIALTDEEAVADDDMEYDVPTACKYLNVVMEGKQPALGDSDYYDDLDIGSDFNGADIKEFLESLGYEFEFEGQQGRFGSNGVYFIRADRKKAPKGDAADQLKWKDPDDFTAEDLIDIDALVEAYKKYLMTVRGYDAVDAAIAATDMQNPYDCPYVLQDYNGDYTIDGVEYEVRECRVDMTVCGFYYLAGIPKFRFFMLLMMEDLADRKVSTYCDARKKYVLEPCAD